MGVIPTSKPAQLAFFEQHIAQWTANAASIGLTPGQATGIAAFTAQARATFDEAQDARQASKDATLAQNIAFDGLLNFGADLIKIIRAYAEVNDSPMVYTLAGIPQPAEPTPLGPPATPTDLVATLNTSGGVVVTFKGSKAGGTAWVVERRTVVAGGGTPTAWSKVGITETKSYTDEALPQGLDSVQYRVIASRSGGLSAPTQPVVLQFGTVAGASQSGAPQNTAGIKLAA